VAYYNLPRDINMKYIFFICFIPIIFSSPYNDIEIYSDDDCWPNNSSKQAFATRVIFSSKVAYGKDNCSIHITNPWFESMQNGFGLFLAQQQMDCSSIITVDCLPNNQTTTSSAQFTCHNSQQTIEMPCKSISITFKRNIKMQEKKKTVAVQVVALVKEPCGDRDLFFQCSKDYPHSCIDEKLRCNGRSECPDGNDEYNCLRKHPGGISWFGIFLIILGSLFLCCILSSVVVFFCCRAAFLGIARRFRGKKGNTSIEKGDITITGEDAGLMKGLAAPTTVVEILPQQHTEPAPLIIDSTKPVYPRLE